MVWNCKRSCKPSGRRIKPKRCREENFETTTVNRFLDLMILYQLQRLCSVERVVNVITNDE